MENVDISSEERFVEEDLELKCWRAEDLPEKYILQLIQKSRQPHIMEYEGHEDAEGRFKDIESYKKWTEKGRIVYLVFRRGEDELGGIIWFGKSKNPNIDPKYDLTFGIRLYEGLVGKRLSKPLMRLAHRDIKKYYDSNFIWLDYDEANEIAGKAYETYGYEELARADGRVVMGMNL